MTYVNPYLEEKAAEYRRQDYRHQAALEQMCCDAGIDQRGPLTRLLCRLLCQAGRLLVMGGRQLERMDTADLTGTSRPPRPI
jgi:hypothetical protein